MSSNKICRISLVYGLRSIPCTVINGTKMVCCNDCRRTGQRLPVHTEIHNHRKRIGIATRPLLTQATGLMRRLINMVLTDRRNESKWQHGDDCARKSYMLIGPVMPNTGYLQRHANEYGRKDCHNHRRLVRVSGAHRILVARVNGHNRIHLTASRP